MKTTTLFILLFIGFQAFGQFNELPDPKEPKTNSSTAYKANEIIFSFIKPEISRRKHVRPKDEMLLKNWKENVWKNEKLNTMLTFWSTDKSFENGEVTLGTKDLSSGKNKINKSHIKIAPIAYVMADDPSHLKTACGINEILDSLLAADRITNQTTFTHRVFENRQIWFSIDVPKDAVSGIYSSEVSVIIKKGSKTKKITIPYTITVANETLIDVKDWEFHLDLWQNPYSSARYYNLKTFSNEHLEKIKPQMLRLANAGQKNITTTLIYDPWNSQTYDKYDGMIKWILKKDGSWKYDYTDFDTWVNYMHSIGVNHYINCYSMIPWNLSFYYYDEKSGKTEILKAKPGEAAYENHWLPFLQDFAKHLKHKGWFAKTTIAMDERPMKDMQIATDIIKKADKDFMISLAGYYHPELSDDIIDYAIPFHEDMHPDILKRRNEKGYKTNLYTCCVEIFPNTFTSCGYDEPVYLMINSIERGFDGYLRWAYDCWNKKPLQDTRYGSWASGDTYLVYPDNQTSIRFERLRDGIQLVEKVKQVRKYLLKQNDNTSVEKLDMIIREFNNDIKNRDLIAKPVETLKNFVNSLKY